MALRLKKIDTDYGIEYLLPYFRIRFVSYDAINNQIGFNGCFYVSQEAREEGAQEIPALYLNDYFPSDEKGGNLFELSYRKIHEIAESLKEKGVTKEDLIRAQDNFMMLSGEDGEIPVNPLYYYFIDAEDC